MHAGSRDLALELAARPDVERLTANHTFQLDPQEMTSTVNMRAIMCACRSE